MPAISIYFRDPEGYDLEFIGILEGKPQSNMEKRVVLYEEWLLLKNK